MKRFRNTNVYLSKNGVVLQTAGREREGKNLVELPTKDVHGYKQIHRLGHYFLVHRMMWETFVGPIPEGYQVDHKDFDTSNNALENLACVPAEENNKRKNPNGKRNHHPVCAGWNKGIKGDDYKHALANFKEVANV